MGSVRSSANASVRAGVSPVLNVEPFSDLVELLLAAGYYKMEEENEEKVVVQEIC